MRLVVGLLALTLTSSFAQADDAKPAQAQAPEVRSQVALRVVSVLPDSRQALLFDKRRGTHVLAEVGSTIGAYRVDAIEEDEVRLSSEGREVVLAGPTAQRPRMAAPAIAPADPYADPGPLDPYAATEGPVDPYATSTPADPYADPAVRVRTIDAPDPLVAGAGGVRVAEAPSESPTQVSPSTSNSPQPPAIGHVDLNVPSDLPPLPTGRTTSAPPSDLPTAGVVITLARADVTAALANFGSLVGAVRGAFTPTGARIDHVAPGSVFSRAGLRMGDLVTAVDGEPMREIDDAADLYIRAAGLQTATVELVRDGKPITLRLAIR